MDDVSLSYSAITIFCHILKLCNLEGLNLWLLLLGLQLLPWGDKLTAESIQFFSPIVLWTRPGSREDFQETVFSAFKDYLAVSCLLYD